VKRSTLLSCAASALFLAATAPALIGQQQAPPAKAAEPRPEVAKTHLKVGDPAPDFSLKDHNGKTVKLRSYRGKSNVVLAFYVLAHTGG
jgi:cytochrome oxidase Cu insertion factor (SCO1/SenC/PrrC family)